MKARDLEISLGLRGFRMVNVDKEFLGDIKNTLERCLIILEDNPKIKDDGEFYTGKVLACECRELLNYLKEG